jgi:hypothetical protein
MALEAVQAQAGRRGGREPRREEPQCAPYAFVDMRFSSKL